MEMSRVGKVQGNRIARSTVGLGEAGEKGGEKEERVVQRGRGAHR